MRARVVLALEGQIAVRVLARLSGIGGIEIAGFFAASDAVRDAAQRQGIETIPLDRLDEELPRIAPDWLINAGASRIYSAALLACAKRGALNAHPGKLPEYAGRHATQWAVRNGETATAATLHWMTEAIDSGPIAFETRVPIAPADTGLAVWLKACDEAALLIVRALETLERGRPIPARDQDLTRLRRYRERDAGDGAIDWNQDAQRVFDFLRAADYSPFKSPSYEPWTSQGGRIWMPERATLASGSDHPGKILEVTPTSATIACGNEHAVRVVKAKWKDGAAGFEGLIEGAVLA